MPANGPEIYKRYEKQVEANHNNRERWDRMAPYISPSRRGIVSTLQPGLSQTQGVYDSTTIAAAELMAYFIAGHIINPSQQWLDYTMAGSTKMNQLREWLEECRGIALRKAASSLFYAEGPESLIDYGGFGTGCLLAEEVPQPSNMTIKGFRGFLFSAEKTGRFYIGEGTNGLVDTLFRDNYEMTARIAKARFSQAGDSIPENISKAIEGGEVDKPFKFIHAITPRGKGDQTYGAKGMPWASCWIEVESKHVCHEGGYKRFPAAVPRYQRTPGEVFGRGRGDIAFPDTWTLNTAKRMGLEDWALKIKPPVMVRHDSVVGTLRLIPAGPTYINTHGGSIRDQIMPWETGSRPEVSQIKEEELRRSIREIFFVDSIRQLLETSKSEMTAYEFARKISLLFRLLGPVYGRMEFEFLYQVGDLMFMDLLEAGQFPPPPPEIAETDGIIGIEFQNPLALAQRVGEAEALTMVMQDVAPLAQLQPQMLDLIDPDKTMAGIMSIRGIPASWTRSMDSVMKLREERQKQNEAQQQMDQLESVSNAVGKAAPVMTANPNGNAT